MEYKEEELVSEMVNSIENEVKRLNKLKEEPKNLIGKVNIVAKASMCMAKADGVTFKELDKIYNIIFKKYCITGKKIRAYINSMDDHSISSIKEDLKKYNIEQDFLKDLFEDIYSLIYADGDVTKEEELMVDKISMIFNI